MPTPKIRHLAIFVRDTEKVAKFYQNVFDMELVGSKGPGKSQYLSDGYLTLAILPHSTEGSVPTGLNHFGFSVTDRAEVTQRMVSEGVGEPHARPRRPGLRRIPRLRSRRQHVRSFRELRGDAAPGSR